MYNKINIDINDLILKGKINGLSMGLTISEVIDRLGEPDEIIDYGEYGKCIFYRNLEVFVEESHKVDYYKYILRSDEVFFISLLEGISKGEKIKFFKRMSLANLFYILQNIKCNWDILNSGGKYDNDFLTIEVNKSSKIWYDLRKKQIDFISAESRPAAVRNDVQHS